MNPPPAPPLPTISYDPAKALPTARLRSLQNYAQSLMVGIHELQANVHGYGLQTGPSWPDILSSYNKILQQTALVSQQLTGTDTVAGSSYTANLLASQAQTNEWPRPPMNKLPHVLMHPTLPIPDHHMAETLTTWLATARPEPIVKSDIALVDKFEKTRAAAGRENASPEEIIKEMRDLREEHDGRADRALRAVQMLRDRYHWKTRPDFAREAELEQEERAKQAAKELGHDADAASTDEAEENETEGQLIVENDELNAPAESAINDAETHQETAMDEDDDKPLDSDDDLFEEVA
ncbi:hypothetical protein FRB94_005841 [Tulasnella sp. JGI-2019a]|nr:hypothetical protein FRB94_005841 [Tulasnella sp. JGI-2019a]KAG9036589.1 hypothetical protein FRB95_008423 [Tulasnella sp. JGI-2019a]